MTAAPGLPTVTPPGDGTAAPLLQVRGLCKQFPVYGKGWLKKQVGLVRAVDEVSFDLRAGETLGLVGESGSGKTTTGRTILRAHAPTAGQVWFRAQAGGAAPACAAPGPSAADPTSAVDLAALSEAQLKPLRTQLQMIFQDPFSSLNPRMTVRDLVAEPLVIHSLARGSEREDRVVDMLRRVDLQPEHRTRYPHAFSGGQRQRIGIARALIMHPRLVVCDEAVSALDVSVQAQVINLLADLQQDLGLTYLFIAHDLSVVRHICDRVAVMYAGRIVELAPTRQLFEAPRHPYTRALLSAVPSPDPDVPMHTALGGEVADPGNLPAGCSFHPRCPLVTQRCRQEVPQLRRLAGGDTHEAACHEA